MEQSKSLGPREVFGLMQNLHDAGAVNLDLPVSKLVKPITTAVGDPGARGGAGEVGLHILCCNEYALVTGLTEGPDAQRAAAIRNVSDVADSVKAELETL